MEVYTYLFRGTPLYIQLLICYTGLYSLEMVQDNALLNQFFRNALMWLMDYRFDGLRFDAVHAIPDRSFLTELAERVHTTVEPGRHVHLVLENEDNRSSQRNQAIAKGAVAGLVMVLQEQHERGR